MMFPVIVLQFYDIKEKFAHYLQSLQCSRPPSFLTLTG
jgi:hypothetical protein